MPARSGHCALLRGLAALNAPSYSSTGPGPLVWLSHACLSYRLNTSSISSSLGHVACQQDAIEAMCTPAQHLPENIAARALFSQRTSLNSQPQLRFEWPGGLHCVRHAHMHLAPRPMLVQDADTVYIDTLLSSSSGQLENLALPVLRYSMQFNPQQTARTLERLPRLVDWQLQRLGGLAPRVLTLEQQQMLTVLTGKLAARLARVAVDCNIEDIAQGLWGLGAACRRQTLPPPASVSRAFSACSYQLLIRLPVEQQPLDKLATVVWACAAARQGEGTHVRRLVHAVADRVARLPDEVAASALDHRTVTKLACALDALRVGHNEAAGRVLATAMTQLLTQQLQAHDPSTGPLQPRFFYRYRTVRNGPEVTLTPKPPRPSKYLHDNSPTLIARDFELSTLAPTLRALGNMRAVTPGLMDAATRHLLASRQDGSSSSSSSSSSSIDVGGAGDASPGCSSVADARGGGGGSDSSDKAHPQPPAALAALHALLGARLPLSPRMVGQLLLPLAAGDQGHAPRAARTLRLAVGCGLPASHPVMRLLLQQLTDSLAPALPALNVPGLADGSAAAGGASGDDGSRPQGRLRQGGPDASAIIPGAEGPYTWVHKRAGYLAKRAHLWERRERHRRTQSGGAGRQQQQQVARLSPYQAALTACALIRSGAQGEGALSILDTLVAQAASPAPPSSAPSWGSVTHGLSRFMQPFRAATTPVQVATPMQVATPASQQQQQQQQQQQELAACADSAKHVRAIAKLVYALAGMTHGKQGLERVNAHKRQLVDVLSVSPHVSSTDALHVALALAAWKSPAPLDPALHAQQQQRQQAEVGNWLQRAIAATAAVPATAAATHSLVVSEGETSAGGQSAAGRHPHAATAVAASAATDEHVTARRWAAEEAERRAWKEGKEAAARAFVQGLPVAQARVLALAVQGQGASALPAHVVGVLQERAGFV